MSQPAEAIQPQAQPATLGGVVAYLSVDGAVKASEFYQKAFGAQEVACMPVGREGPDHAHPPLRQWRLADAERSLS